MKTIAEVEAVLAPYVQIATETFGKDITTNRTLALSKHVGSPHRRLRVVHIAGTSGKTSTSYYIRELLEAAGKKTGLTISPHIMGITERVQISGTRIADSAFVAHMSEFMEYVKTCEDTPTFFEIMVVFALWVFDKEGVEYAVLETGLGGLHDSTNICRREDKVCVITDIGFDHTHILGNTIREIAEQKCGIIAHTNDVVMYGQSEEVMAVVKKATELQDAKLHVANECQLVADQDWLADFQKRNWCLAKNAYGLIKDRDNLPELSYERLVETMHVQVPGRVEVFRIGDKTVVLDGAHNEQKMRAFWESFEHLFPGQRPTVVFGVKVRKDIDAIAPMIATQANNVIITAAKMTQDFSIGAGMPVEEIAHALESYGLRSETIADSDRAIKHALASSADLIVVTGSLYLVAEIRPILVANVL
jgi:dihydrofolate synthase/folylpolyglutamate synthase